MLLKSRMTKPIDIRHEFSLILIGCALFFGCENTSKQHVDSHLVIERKVDSLLALMTLEEKIGQMTQVRHFYDIQKGDVASKFIGSVIHTNGPLPGENALGWQGRFSELQKEALSTRLGIPLLFGVDAVHGQNTFEGATIFPHNIGLGATANAALVEKVAAATAVEAQATGFNWVFSPCIAIPYNEKWGRVYEAFSESTTLTQKLTKASIMGHQGRLSDRATVMATAKHFIGDGATDYGIEGGNTTISSQELNARLLPPYRTAVAENVGAVMASFNTLHGQPLHAHKVLITDTLKTKMGFDGIVLTDWKGYSKYGQNDIINAGIDMVMAVDGDLNGFQAGLKRGVATDAVSIERVNDAVKRILRQKYRLDLFAHPFPDSSLVAKIGSTSHRDIARQAVRESMVLLKNDNNILPIDKANSKIVVVGEHANNSGLQSGGWTITWQGNAENYLGATTILEGLQKLSKTPIIYDEHASGSHFDADVAVIVVGEKPYAEFFGDVNEDTGFELTLSETHQNYIKTYADAGVNTVVVLISGRPLVVTKQLEQVDAFVAAWLPGSEGHGIAEVLFGNYNFTGKLPHSWPISVDDFNGRFGPNYWDDSITPLFEFGYGLSYEVSNKES